MISNVNKPSGTERQDRVALFAEVRLRRSGGHPFIVRVFNLSAEGCKMEFVERPAVGEAVWIKLPGLDSIQATVRWIEGHYGGVQFERPLYEPVFRRLTDQYPSS